MDTNTHLLRLVARGAIAELPPADRAKVEAAEAALRQVLTDHGEAAKLAFLALIAEVATDIQKA